MVDIQEIVAKQRLLDYKEQKSMSGPEKEETFQLAMKVKQLIEQYKIENE